MTANQNFTLLLYEALKAMHEAFRYTSHGSNEDEANSLASRTLAAYEKAQTESPEDEK